MRIFDNVTLNFVRKHSETTRFGIEVVLGIYRRMDRLSSRKYAVCGEYGSIAAVTIRTMC